MVSCFFIFMGAFFDIIPFVFWLTASSEGVKSTVSVTRGYLKHRIRRHFMSLPTTLLRAGD